jgi:hypothetical protein
MGLILPPPLGILQNDQPLMVVGRCPILDLLQRAEAAYTCVVIVQAAVSDTRRFNGDVHVGH